MNMFDDIAAAQVSLHKAIVELERDYIGPRGEKQLKAQIKRALHDSHEARQSLERAVV